MKRGKFCVGLRALLLCSVAVLRAQEPAGSKTPDESPHQVQKITVAQDVTLEVLDWGGTGRALVLLAGKGFTAHEFDQFSPTLTDRYHVYGITRRGYEISTVPPTTDANYTADQLADDVLKVLDQLKLVRPVLAGHSIAGEELSSLGTRAPDKVAGLVYLDAGYAYAFYDSAVGDLTIDYNALRLQLDRFTALVPMKERKQILTSIAEGLPRFEKDLAPYQARFASAPDAAPAPPDTVANRVDVAIFRGNRSSAESSAPFWPYMQTRTRSETGSRVSQMRLKLPRRRTRMKLQRRPKPLAAAIPRPR